MNRLAKVKEAEQELPREPGRSASQTEKDQHYFVQWWVKLIILDFLRGKSSLPVEIRLL